MPKRKLPMKKELKVAEYDNKETLINQVNKNSNNIEIVSITSGGTTYGAIRHFVWFYDLE